MGLPLYLPPPVFTQNMGSQSQPQVETHLIMGCQTVLDHVGTPTVLPIIPHNQSQAPLGCKLSTHGTVLESQ